MRKLLWFTIGFSISAAVGAYFLSVFWLLIFTLCACVVFFGLYFFRNKVPALIFVILTGFMVGALYFCGYEHIMLRAAKAYDGITMPVEVQATDFSFETDCGAGVDGKTNLNGKIYRIRLYFQEDYAVNPGDTLRLNARFRYTPSGGLQVSTYHKAEGIFLLAYGEGEPAILKADENHTRHFAAYLRRGICNQIMKIFPEDAAAFAKALLLGDDSDISFRDNITFQRSGIRHIIAVSGLHISILFSVIYSLTARRRRLVLLIGLPVLLLFAAVTGFTPSIVRACIMQLLLIISINIDREYDPWTALATACMVMLLANPLVITSVSFQLSVGCMVGIFLFSGRIRDYLSSKIKCKKPKSILGKTIRWFIGSVSVSVSAMVATMPLCALYFGMVSAIGIITNLLVLWIISYVFFGIILACLLSIIWMPLGNAMAWMVSWLIRYVLWVARLLSSVPVGVAYTDSPFTVLWIAITIVLLVVFVGCKKKSSFLLPAIVTVTYLLSLTASWILPRIGEVQVTVIDVGQGQCVLLQNKNDAYMIDCGGSDPKLTASAALNALGAQGIYQLDGLILTHYDEDHCNGVNYLLEVIPVKQLYLPDTQPDSLVRQQLQRSEIPITWITENRRTQLQTGVLDFYPAISGTSSNESSMCILFQGKNCDILITGDRTVSGEHMLLEQARIPKVEFLVAGHHGAATSTGEELLTYCKGAVVAISAGENNIHMHPHPETLERIKAAGCIIRRTDLEGTIIFRR